MAVRPEAVRAAIVLERRQEATMVKRERFVTHVTCPQCALNGSATWEEDESRNLETTIKSLSHGFKIGPDMEIYCADCGVKATIGRTLSRSEMKRPTTPK